MLQKSFLLSVFFLGLLACNKVDLEGDYAYIVGDYEWVYTEFWDLNYQTYKDTDDRFGIRISDNKKVYFFKNGAEVAKYKIRYLNIENGKVKWIEYKVTHDSGKFVHFRNDIDTVMVWDFPAPGTRNPQRFRTMRVLFF